MLQIWARNDAGEVIDRTIQCVDSKDADATIQRLCTLQFEIEWFQVPLSRTFNSILVTTEPMNGILHRSYTDSIGDLLNP